MMGVFLVSFFTYTVVFTMSFKELFDLDKTKPNEKDLDPVITFSAKLFSV